MFGISRESRVTVVAEKLEEWPGSNSLRHVPELRFSYEEEASPEGFFVPYVWTLMFSHTTIPWRAQVGCLMHARLVTSVYRSCMSDKQ